MDIIEGFFHWLFVIFKDEQTAYSLAAFLIVAGAVVAMLVLFSWVYYSRKLGPLSKELKNILKSASTRQERRRLFAERFESIRDKFEKSPLEHSWFEFEEVVIQDNQQGIIKNTVRPHHFFHLTDLKYQPSYFISLPNVFIGVGLLFTFIGLAAAIHGAAGSITGDVKVAQEGLKAVLGAASVKFITSITGLGISIILSALFIRPFSHFLDSEINAMCTNMEKCMKAITSQDIQENQLSELEQQSKVLKNFTDTFAVNLGDEFEKRLHSVFNASVSEALGSNISSNAKDHVESVMMAIGDMKGELSDIAEKVSNSGQGFVDGMANAAKQMQEILEDNLQDSAKKIGDTMAGTAEELKGSLAAAGESFSDILIDASSQIKSATGELSDNISKFVRGIDTFDKQIMNNIEGFEQGSRNIRETISALDDTAANIRSAGEPIAVVAKEFNKSSEAILSASESITEAYDSIKEINQKIASYTETVSQSWQEYRDRFENVDESLSNIFKEFDENVQAILDKMSAFSGKLDETFNKAGGELHTAVASLKESVDELIDNKEAA